jgi:hypothetical protein
MLINQKRRFNKMKNLVVGIISIILLQQTITAKSYDDLMEELNKQFDFSILEEKPKKPKSNLVSLGNTKQKFVIKGHYDASIDGDNPHLAKYGGDIGTQPDYEPAIKGDITVRNLADNYIGLRFGYSSLKMNDSAVFRDEAIDNKALNISGEYGHYFMNGDEHKRYFATGQFEFLQLKQAHLKNIVSSINIQRNLKEDVSGYIGLVGGVSYLTWDIPQHENSISHTSTSPLIGIRAGVEYHFDDGISATLSGSYYKYSHKTEVPNDTLTLNGGGAVYLGFKFYQ